jgi:hypothetical protein
MLRAAQLVICDIFRDTLFQGPWKSLFGIPLISPVAPVNTFPINPLQTTWPSPIDAGIIDSVQNEKSASEIIIGVAVALSMGLYRGS